ncbi:hypothetical protein GCM10022395_35230 [Snuella lapsa]|uniref:TonB-dependent receptor plug domain-containing protein n=1 Tax=Snuella lapsa TaxID=870481 RepID=A0ABP6YIE6_9FLAO
MYSQNEEKPLAEVISFLEVKYKVQFNYAEDTVKGLTVKWNTDLKSLDDSLAYLQNATSLLFTRIGAHVISIKHNPVKILCGTIRDMETRALLSVATIQMGDEATTSDEKGVFELQVKDTSKPIVIRYLGYKTTYVTYNALKDRDCPDIFLMPNFQRLTEVLISNYIVNGINKINNGSFDIDFSKFDILPGLIEADVLQSVQNFPGVQSSNETVSNINIRGGTHDQNLILWDGIKMYQSGHFFGLISMYNPLITQYVSLRKNGSSAVFSDGVSGTIDMQSSKRVNSKFKGMLGANLTNVNGYIDTPVGKTSSIQIAARKSIGDFVETPTYKAFFDRISQNTEVANNQMNITNSDKSFDFHDMSLRWLYRITEKDKLRLNFINVHNRLIFNENANLNNNEESRKSSLSQQSIAGAINYERDWTRRLQTVLEIYETDYKLQSINANILDAQRFLQENIVSETSTKLKMNYAINERFQFLNGYHFIETKVTNLDDVDSPLFRSLVSEVLRAHAVFSEIGYRSLSGKTNLNLGIRYNYLSKFHKQLLEPRFSFSHKFLNYFTWEVLGEFKHQNTSQVINFQSDFLGIEKRRWQLSNNNDVPVIQGKQVSTGISYNKKGWLLNVDAYYKKVTGITSQSQGFQNQFEFVKSTGSYEVKGGELLLRKAIHSFNSWLSYSYMDNSYFFKDLSVTRFPSNYDITHMVTFGTAYSLNKLKVSAGFNWYTGKPTTRPLIDNSFQDNVINYGAPNSDRLRDYMRLDFSAMYDFKIWNNGAVLGVSVWNVLDQENEINNFYRLRNNTVNKVEQYSLGITPNMVFRLAF